MKIAFIGLGQMGSGMARNLVRAGHDLAVYNRTRSRAEELEGEGARVADSPADAASSVDVLITMLADDEAVEQVIFGDGGAIESLPRGAVHVSRSNPTRPVVIGLPPKGVRRSPRWSWRGRLDRGN